MTRDPNEALRMALARARLENRPITIYVVYEMPQYTRTFYLRSDAEGAPEGGLVATTVSP